MITTIYNFVATFIRRLRILLDTVAPRTIRDQDRCGYCDDPILGRLPRTDITEDEQFGRVCTLHYDHGDLPASTEHDGSDDAYNRYVDSILDV